MKIRIHTISSLVLAMLAGCGTTMRTISADDVRNRIHVATGYASCPSCANVKTYSSPPVVQIATRYSSPQATGWINAQLTLVLTNRTTDFVPQYQLIAQFTNNGDFAEGTDIYVDGAKLDAASGRFGDKCFSSVGSGCSWSQAYVLGARQVEEVLKKGSSIDLLVGRPVQTVARINDGYTPHVVMNRTLVGVPATIPASVVAGFVEGLREKGAQVPTSTAEAAERQGRRLAQADRTSAAQERLDRERPLKLKVAAQVCRQEGMFTQTGFVEDAANGKVKIRISDAVVSGTRMRAGDFHEQIIWDNPDNWFLCGAK